MSPDGSSGFGDGWTVEGEVVSTEDSVTRVQNHLQSI